MGVRGCFRLVRVSVRLEFDPLRHTDCNLDFRRSPGRWNSLFLNKETGQPFTMAQFYYALVGRDVLVLIAWAIDLASLPAPGQLS